MALIKATLIVIAVMVLLGSCSKTPGNPDLPASEQIEIDSIIYTRSEPGTFEIYKRSVYTFESDSVAGHYKMNCFDSIRQYNNIYYLHYTQRTFWYEPFTNKLIRVHSKSKFRWELDRLLIPEPFESDVRGNFEARVSNVGEQATPSQIVFRQFKDSTSTSVEYEFKFTRDYTGSIAQPDLYLDQATGTLFHGYKGDVNYEEAPRIAINLKDSIYISDHSFDLENLVTSLGLGNTYKTADNSSNIFHLNKDGTVKSFSAVNFDYEWIRIDQSTLEGRKKPLLERKIDYTYDKELVSAMEPLFSRKYLANLAIMKMLFPRLGNVIGIGGYDRGWDREYLYLLKVISNTAVDSLFDVKDGKRDFINTRKTTSMIERDNRGRVSAVTKFFSPYNTTEKFEFVYKR